MITKIVKSDTYTYYGLSTDTKPTTQPNGSVFIEMDKGDVYFWDKENATWRKM